MGQDQRNYLLAIGLALIIFVIWDSLVISPQRKLLRESQVPEHSVTAPAFETEAELRPRADILAKEQRISIDAPALSGSISRQSLQIDDLKMKRHFVSLAREVPVTLLSPQGAEQAYYAQQGWSGLPSVPKWRSSGSTLGPDLPLELIGTGDGYRISRTISIDQNYMLTIADRVENTSSGVLRLAPIALVRQHGLPDDWHNFAILHEGAIGVMEGKLKLLSFKKLQKGRHFSEIGNGGWIGLTSKYWMTALVPDQSEPVTISSRAIPERGGSRIFEVGYQGAERNLAPGTSLTYQGQIFAGAKELAVLRQYGEEHGLDRFADAVDWGNLWFFTKPIFMALDFFNSWLGNFGFAILALTVLVKLVFVPMQNSSYATMAEMRKLMPEMEKLKKRFAADPQRQQKEIMELYRREKVNPLSGCLPLIPQMFVFFALYKTLFVTLEMRHEPFIGWIRDLSAPDPLMPLNLFGLLPWDPSAIPLLGGILGIGTWPVLYGLTMWALQSLSPPPPDPTQRAIMRFLPIIFTFIFAGFASGLVIYWTWSNILSIIQQYWIMRRHGVETGIDRWWSRIRGRSAPPS